MAEKIKDTALVIKSINWRDSSKIVTLFSRETGKLSVIAKGALRNKSPFSGRLETLNLLDTIISVKPNRELQIITQCDLLEPFPTLKTDMNRLPFALAILETVNEVIASGAGDPPFFDFVVTLLHGIQSGEKPDIVFAYFLLKLSSYLGFKPDFSACQNCGSIKFTTGLLFANDSGALFCRGCATNAFHLQKMTPVELQFLKKLQNFPHRRITEMESETNIRQNIYTVMLNYLNYHLEHPLQMNSLQLLPVNPPAP